MCLFAKEHDSKLFACFLDIHKAFDKVWHNGLFVKLYNMGIRSKLLKLSLTYILMLKALFSIVGSSQMRFQCCKARVKDG